MQYTLRVGVITSTHGIKGEVKVFPTTDDVKRFEKIKEVLLDAGSQTASLEIQNIKYFKNLAIIKFKGIENIDDAQKYKGKDLYVTRDNAVELDEGEYFIADLLGLTVITEEGEILGELKDVLQTGANDVYIIKSQTNKELLIPAIKDCIRAIDLKNKTMTIHVLEGLLEV